MNLSRLELAPRPLLDFYQSGLNQLGAVTEQTWHDRLQVVAEARAARVWNETGALMDTELHFPEPDTTVPRDASREIFPGCPLTFRLAEALLPSPLTLDRAVLNIQRSSPPPPEVADKLWLSQISEPGRWQLGRTFQAAFHYSLMALIRCEIQAIDQNWSLHRVAIALANGLPDDTLAAEWDFAELVREQPSELAWPSCAPVNISRWIEHALQSDLATPLDNIQQRQQNYLRRELRRIDEYFAEYERELTERTGRTQKEPARIKNQDRLAAAKAEHARRRADQIQRHEIQVLPRIDALLLVAEPAWQTTATQSRRDGHDQKPAHFVPRNRRWYWDSDPSAIDA